MFSVLLWLSATARAADETYLFEIDAAQSVMNATLTFHSLPAELPFVGQGDAGLGIPGTSNGLSFSLGGTIEATFDDQMQRIRMLGHSEILTLPSGEWLPAGGLGPGVSPGAIGAFLDFEPATGVAGTVVTTIRDLDLDLYANTGIPLQPTGSDTYLFSSQLSPEGIVPLRALYTKGTQSVAGLSGIASALPSLEVPFDLAFEPLIFNNGQLQVLGDGTRTLQVPVDIMVERFVDDGSFLGIGPIVVDYRIQGTLYATSTSLAPEDPTFERGDFEGWQVLGDAEVVGAFADGPVAGNFQALLRNGAGSVPIEEILAAVGPISPSNALPDSGTFIYRTFEAQKGDSITFEYNFLTDEPTIGFGDTNDSAILFADLGGFRAFGTITPQPFSSLHPSSNGFAFESGWKTGLGFFVLESGPVTVGFMVGDGSFDSTKHSALLIDNVRVGPVVPEPSSVCLLLIGGAGVALVGAKSRARKRRKRNPRGLPG